jgi:hypothetical protein
VAVLVVLTHLLVRRGVLVAALGLTTQVQILQAELPHQAKVMLVAPQQIVLTIFNQAAAVALEPLVVMAQPL